MDDTIELWSKPAVDEVYMIAGWRQWADGGSVSSGVPHFLVEQLGAKQVGRLRSHGFYLYQLPGAQGLLRPVIKLEDGRRRSLEKPDNQIFYWDDGNRGLVIFLGDEPHLNIDGYAEAFFGMAKALSVRRVAALGGVYAPVPYDQPREISCTYSLRKMKKELDRYALSFSAYEGGASIGSYLADEAENQGIEYVALYAMVPYYDFSETAADMEPVGLEEDYAAWYDVLGRLNHMYNLGLDLGELRQRSERMAEAMAARLGKLERRGLPMQEYLAKVNEGFRGRPFAPLGDIWEQELKDLFDNEE